MLEVKGDPVTEPLENEEMEALRNQIWDFVYRAGNPQTINSIVDDLHLSDDSVREAVHHAWFVCEGDTVAIA
ncbi:hypothetical protein CA51_39890 [Rosistilla oblonga]|uniref:Uncharacterized protein n=1 Tax=Rosistilla oblonga TaxID=2527990 RepID=A0A518IX97_9BACT|nr:hypothetical protein [Rosistilla oblonga]QDV14095.1 hypothetical protein CA51_39890 [Rosistilla oblonga]QDV57711.1 hypothetical protein Mal33_37240 [Rosistilla oblonga]